MMESLASGLTRRLNKLKRGLVFSILALDHGLSSGAVKCLDDVCRWSHFADAVGIAAVVANIGVARALPANRKHALILQTIGSPRILGHNASRRVVNTSIEEAMLLDADGVSVQIDFDSESVEATVAEIASIRMRAQRIGLPVLFMITTPKRGFKDPKDIADAVRVCDELGADVIKTAYECQSYEEWTPLSSFGKGMAPLVLAGGEAGDQFKKVIGKAKVLGFSGYCVGRNIFQSDDPRTAFDQIEKAFA